MMMLAILMVLVIGLGVGATVAAEILSIVALVDVARRRNSEFDGANRSRGAWIAVLIASAVVFGVFGLIPSLVYLRRVRPELDAARWAVAPGSGRAGYLPGAAWGQPLGPAGWFADPARRHDARYFDGRTWTEHVSDRGKIGNDPL